MEDVLGYLQSKPIQVKQVSPTEVHTHCWYCNEDPSKRGRLYINVDPTQDPPGLFMCHLCGEKGALNKIKKYFGDPISSEQEQVFKNNKILKVAANYFHDNLAERTDVLEWLQNERGLTVDVIIDHKLGWGDGGLKKFLMSKGYSEEEIVSTGLVSRYGRDFFYSHVTIPYMVQGQVVSIRGKDMGGKYLTVPGDRARVFNSDACFGSDEVVLTEGEFDALVLESVGFKACGVPGANTWKDAWGSYFDGVKKVHVCFDADDAGRSGAEKVARSLGPKAKIVSMPESSSGVKIDPTEYIAKQGHTKEDFEILLKRSKSGHLVSVDDAFDEWKNVEGNPNLSGLSIGLPDIDRFLAPGLLPGQVMVILAKTGSGKTIILLNIFHRIATSFPEKKMLFISLEQTRNEWFERARRIHRFYDLNATNKDTLDLFRPRFMMADRNRVTENELTQILEQYHDDVGDLPDLVAVDYLGYWARSYKGEAYERTSEAIMSMKKIAKETKLRFITPHQVSRVAGFGEEPDVGASRDSGVIEETADFVLLLWSPDQQKGKTLKDRTGEVNLKIGKSRHGGVGAIQNLIFAPLSLTMVPSSELLLANRARDERQMALKGDDFDTAIMRHRTGNRDLIVPSHLLKNGAN